MQFTEMGRDDGKTLVLLPGTACTRQINSARVIDALAEQRGNEVRSPQHNSAMVSICSSGAPSRSNRGPRPRTVPIVPTFCPQPHLYIANGTVGMLREWVNSGFPVSSREIAEMMYAFSLRVTQ